VTGNLEASPVPGDDETTDVAVRGEDVEMNAADEARIRDNDVVDTGESLFSDSGSGIRLNLPRSARGATVRDRDIILPTEQMLQLLLRSDFWKRSRRSEVLSRGRGQERATKRNCIDDRMMF
jgi:hypothetical protein